MIRQRKDRDGLQVQVYAGRDPPQRPQALGQPPGSRRRPGRHEARQAGRGPAPGRGWRRSAPAVGDDLAQLLDEWLTWRESNGKPISPATLHGYRLTVETKIKPALGYLPVAKVDARVLDRFYAALRKAGNVRTGGGKLSASRIRDVHAILSGALGLGRPLGLRAVHRGAAGPAAGAAQRRPPAAHGRAGQGDHGGGRPA